MPWVGSVARALFSGCALSLTLLTPLAAQSKEQAPKRPKLAENQDTNNAVNYYNLGAESLARDPRKAADAFYWASRIDPVWAAPLYARFAALLISRSDFELGNYILATDNNGRKSFRQLDSIAYLAQLKNAYVDRTVDAIIINTWLRRQSGGEFTLSDLGRFDRRFTAWAASARGNYAEASKIYREVVKQRPEDLNLRWMQSNNYFSAKQYDSAGFAARAALGLIRDSEQEVLGWMPHAYGEYAVGFLYAVQGEWDSARAAYERSILDDLAFYPAHRDLGRLRLITGDTAGAMVELNEAASLAPTEVGILHDLSTLLMKKGKVDSASKLLKFAIAQEPWYAAPYLPMAVIYETSGYRDEAIVHYRTFLALAAKGNPQIAIAERRLAAVKASQ